MKKTIFWLKICICLKGTWHSSCWKNLSLRISASARMVVGLSQLPARRRGTHCQHTVVWRTAPLHLDNYLRPICFLSTSVYSALGVSAIMRYINWRFTYLLKSSNMWSLRQLLKIHRLSWLASIEWQTAENMILLVTLRDQEDAPQTH